MILDCIHYVSSSIIAGDKNFIAKSPKKVLTFLSISFGIILMLYIRIKANSK